MPGSDYAAILVAFHSGRHIGRALASLAAQEVAPAEVVVVENSSDRRTERLARDIFPAARVFFPGSNLGFAGAVNLAFRETIAPSLFLLNPDAAPAPDYVRLLLAAADGAPMVGMTQGLLWKTRRGRRVIDSLGHVRGRDGMMRNLGDGLAADAAAARDLVRRHADVLVGVTGAAALFARAMLEDLAEVDGPFDETFGTFLEDADLGLRAAARGWETRIVPEAACRHERGVSYRLAINEMARVRARLCTNHLLLAAKHDSGGRLLRDLPWMIAGQLVWATLLARYPLLLTGAFLEAAHRLPRVIARRRPIVTPLVTPDYREELARRRRARAAAPEEEPAPSQRAAIDAVVVSYRNGASVIPLLDALTRDPALASVTLVDSASRDETATLARAVAGVRVLEQPDNRGFAAAVNRGAEEGSAPFLLLANADILPRGALAPLLASFSSPDIAVVAPRLVNPDGSLQPSTHGELTFWKAWGQGRRRTRTFLDPFLRLLSRFGRGLAASFWDHDRRREIDGASGAALLVRRSAWEEVGGLDERFFLWHEDADFCRRVRAAGYRIIFDPVLEVEHVEGVSRRYVADSETHRRRSVRLYAERYWSAPARAALRLLAR